jgi:hypothetical protein
MSASFKPKTPENMRLKLLNKNHLIPYRVRKIHTLKNHSAVTAPDTDHKCLVQVHFILTNFTMYTLTGFVVTKLSSSINAADIRL